VAYALLRSQRHRDQYDGRRGKNPEREVELLEKALQRDPSFALGLLRLAKTQCDLFSVTGGIEDLSGRTSSWQGAADRRCGSARTWARLI